MSELGPGAESSYPTCKKCTKLLTSATCRVSPEGDMYCRECYGTIVGGLGE